MRYAVWAPPYRHKSGGIRALHVLCEELRKRGQDAGIVSFLGDWQPSPYDAPRFDHDATGDVIHVYPEIITDNPGGGLYARWLLNKADLDGACWGWMPSMRLPVLHVPIIDLRIFYPRSGSRRGVGVWCGKQLPNLSRIPDGATMINIDHPESREDLADLLGGFEYIISFDPFSSLVTEATLCGTPVRVFTTPQWSRNDLNNPFEKPFGIAFDEQDWTIAVDSVKDAHEAYRIATKRMLWTVDEFVESAPSRCSSPDRISL